MAWSASFPFPPLLPRDTEEAWFPRLEVDELEMLIKLEERIEKELTEVRTVTAPAPLGVVERREEDEEEDEEATADEEEVEEDDEGTEFDDDVEQDLDDGIVFKAMKRAREESHPQGPPLPQEGGATSSTTFSFGFFESGGDEGEKKMTQITPTTATAVTGREAILTASGESVRVLWEESTHRRLLVIRHDTVGASTLTVKPAELSPLDNKEEGQDGTACLSGHVDSPTILHMDTTFDPPPPSSASPWAPIPPPFEPSLSSLIWPIKPQDFLSTMYSKRAMAVHGTGERLVELKGALDGLDVDQMLGSASKIVVWMKALHTGKMQYLDANADVASSCYRAGHSLYFNPSLQLQQEFLSKLTRDLGMGFASSLDGGMGGDIELFAVKGPHVTPWHIDGQENFTIQLRGCKRWTLAPPHLPDPLTNYHPASSNIASRLANRVLHRSYSSANLSPPSQNLTQEGCETVVLRPGSFLYVPAGVWHRVESLGDHEEGSLSINFSIDGARWGDVVLRCLQPLLWRSERARERVRFTTAEEARQVLREAMGSVQEALQSLMREEQPSVLVPDAVLAEHRPKRVIIDVGDGDEEAEEGGGREDNDDDDDDGDRDGVGAREIGRWQAVQGLAGLHGDGSLYRNPLSVLIFHEKDEVMVEEETGGHRRGRKKRRRDSKGRAVCTVHWGFERDQASGEEGLGGVSVQVEAAETLIPVLQHLERLDPKDAITVEGLLGVAAKGNDGQMRELVKRLAGVLIYHGYLLIKKA